MRLADGRMPSGPYILEFVSVSEILESQAGKLMRKCLLRFVGTDLHMYWFFVNTPPARWAWADLFGDFDVVLEDLAGRQFVAVVISEEYLPRIGDFRKQNRVQQFIAEVIA